jgi:hypothetical protein
VMPGHKPGTHGVALEIPPPTLEEATEVIKALLEDDDGPDDNGWHTWTVHGDDVKKAREFLERVKGRSS